MCGENSEVNWCYVINKEFVDGGMNAEQFNEILCSCEEVGKVARASGIYLACNIISFCFIMLWFGKITSELFG